MKIYIASSWKNANSCMRLAMCLRHGGHMVDCFCDDSTGRFVFSYGNLPDYQSLDGIDFLKCQEAQKAFEEDKKWIDWADAVVMLLPCGRSAHLEAGYAKGRGKKLIIFGDFPVGEFDVMYGFADKLVRLDDQWKQNLLNALKEIGNE